MKRLFLLVLVTMVIICHSETVTWGITDVHTDPNQPTDKDSITIVVSRVENAGPVLIDSNFSMEGTNLELDIFLEIDFFFVETPWSHSEIIGTLPAGLYDLSVYVYYSGPYIGTDTYSTEFAVVQKPMLYWADAGAEKIQRANLDGSGITDLVTTGLDNPLGIAVDVADGKMYWTDWSTDKIQRANLDGTGATDIITDLNYPFDIALDTVGGKMYWTSENTNRIQRANLNGSEVEVLITGPVVPVASPFSVALDIANGHMYWADPLYSKIKRANLNGTNMTELIITGLDYPADIALDTIGGKMYWADSGTDKIQRANLDGSEVEDIITTGLTYPAGIALDIANGKIYWTDVITAKIQRANLDGSEVEDIITMGLSAPYGIVIAQIPEPPIEADVEIEPKTLNLASGGKWLNCHIWLPEDYNVADIEPNSVVLEGEPNDIYAEWIWFNEKQNIVTAKFNRSEIQQMLDDEEIIEIGEAELIVSGELDNGIVFVGTDVIRVTNKGSKNK